MKRIRYALGTAACLLLLLAVLLCAAVRALGTDAGLYARCFRAYADTSRFGVGAEAYDDLAAAIAGYLAGARDTPQAEVLAFGVLRPAFNDRELAHLADIRGLFRLFRWAWVLLIPAAGLGVWLARRPDKGMFALGCGAAVLALAVLALLIARHFEAAFLIMHRLLFTNDLWLLNPNTDLLICLMPEAMVTVLAARLALIVIPAWLLAPTVAVGGWIIIREKRGRTFSEPEKVSKRAR